MMTISLLLFAQVAAAEPPLRRKPVFLGPPLYDERTTQSRCGETLIVVRTRNDYWKLRPSLESITVDDAVVAPPADVEDGGVFSKFRHIDGVEVQCERDTGAPYVTFVGFGKQDDVWAVANEACKKDGGVWINDREETFRIRDGALSPMFLRAPQCVGADRAAPSSSEE
jgi:hypothetical protein